MSKVKKYALPIVVLIIGFVAFRGLKSLKTAPVRRPTQERAQTMAVAPVVYSPVSPRMSVLARVRSKDRARLAAEVSGRVLSNGFALRLGTRVAKGQTLMRLDGATARNTFRIQVGNLMSGVAEMLPEMKIDLPDAYDRWKAFFAELSFDKIPPLPEYADEREKLYLTRFNVFTLYYSARNQQEMVGKYTLRAPFSGVVASATVHPGDMASPGVQAGVLVSTGRYELELPLTQDEFALVRTGMEVSVAISENGHTTTGTVVRMSPVLDDASQTAVAVVEVRGSKHITDGAYAQAEIAGSPFERAFALPREALYKDRYALVITNVAAVQAGKAKGTGSGAGKNGAKPPDGASGATERKVGTMEIREVAIAFVGRDFVYIDSGLTQGELVVVEPTQDVAVGLKVAPVMISGEQG